MEKKKLARHVTVAGTTYGPGDDVPADVAEKITNPKAWVSLEEDAPTDDSADRDAGTASGHRLATAVTVGGRTYGPDDFVPGDVARQITNPKAWQGGRLPPGQPTAPTGDGEPDDEFGESSEEAPGAKQRKTAAKRT